MTSHRVLIGLLAPCALGLVMTACPFGDVRVPGSKDMGEECFDDEECDEPGTCLNGVCSGYPCEGDGSCDNGLACERVSDQQSCVMPCEDTGDCLARQECAPVPRSQGNPDDTITVCL